MKTWKQHIGWILTIVVTVIGWSVAIGAKSQAVSQIEAKVLKLEQDRDELKGDVREMKTDVRWIRQAIERRNQ